MKGFKLYLTNSFLKLIYFRKDLIWKSRKWNWNYSDYIDLSG